MSDRFTTIERRSIWQEVASQISQMIDNGVMAPGEKLPSEREMCQQFGISRISLREALRALERQGFIEVHAGRGAFVRSPADRSQHVLQAWISMGADNVAKVFELRKLFEPNLAALAARSITGENIDRLRAAIEALRVNLNDPEKAIEADADFHRILGESTGNPLIESLVHFVMTATGAERSVTLNSTKGVKQALLGHERILERIVARDEAGARQAMEAHLADAVRFASGKR
ncbi:FadR/GntR family transcriptional regulator [Mesorhizobium sp. VK9D]|uniref:FadR/GntR family transcriptional regulator n=1 Tax=Mesorhizobium australafricanum TaxID=3072311 RepID=UPI002A242DDE|nr:FadR/GntR family transcriptional regulator [Mesorhizobium sp. VK9D]MDX8452330.1 FadR/GntR family transcriptional regulator [Mesorhizobium sp. VK9D]